MNAHAESASAAQRASETTTQQADHSLSPEIAAALDRMAEVLKHLRRDPAPRNVPLYQQPGLFYSLDLQRQGLDFLGRDWESPILPRYGQRFARLRNQVRGVLGLTELLSADFQSRQDSDLEEQFTETLRESLFLAGTELAHAADYNMEFIGDAVYDEAQRPQGAGGAA